MLSYLPLTIATITLNTADTQVMTTLAMAEITELIAEPY